MNNVNTRWPNSGGIHLFRYGVGEELWKEAKSVFNEKGKTTMDEQIKTVYLLIKDADYDDSIAVLQVFSTKEGALSALEELKADKDKYENMSLKEKRQLWQDNSPLRYFANNDSWYVEAWGIDDNPDPEETRWY